jgi:signal transduction histidine kinase
LAIVRRIAQRHGGEVQLLDARDGTGLRVRVRFPASPPGLALSPP